MKITIFYSWQSDLPNATNRSFIEQAIQKAIKAIKAEDVTVLEPCLERDTAGVPGTPDIASTIFRKIDECHVFIGDVSIINPATTTERKTPNPNVLLELGYAANSLTWENVICVFNTDTGDIGDLPFDLRLRRMCTYTVEKDQGNKASERDKLVSKLKEALLPILKGLEVKVQEDAAPKQLTPVAASARVKEYLAEDRYRIQLNELVVAQGNQLAQTIVGPEFPSQGPHVTDNIIKSRIESYDDISQVALAIIVAGCYYGTQGHEKQWIDLLRRVAHPPAEYIGNPTLLRLRRYPIMLLLYGGGLAAVAAENYRSLLALFTKPKVPNEFEHGTDGPLLHLLMPADVIDKDLANRVMNQRWYAPLSEHLFHVLREPMRSMLHDDHHYQRCFDRFEYMRSLLEVDTTGKLLTVGSYAWRWRLPHQDIRQEVGAEEAEAGAEWAPYKAGWFRSQRQRFLAAKSKVDQAVLRLAWY
jgi:hypothetical protein